MSDLRRGLSLRGKFLLIVLGGAVLPLGLFGLWLTGTAERSAEALLRTRLDSSMGRVVDRVGSRWISERSRLLDFCESPSVQGELREEEPTPGAADRPTGDLSPVFATSRTRGVTYADLRDVSGATRWTWSTDSSYVAGPGSSVPSLPVQLDVFENISGELIGTLEAHLSLRSLLPESTVQGGVTGSLLAVFEPGTGAPLLPLSIDPELLQRERFVWAEEPWLVVRQTLHEPPVQLALAAPLNPFLEPFENAARRNLVLLVIVAVGGLSLATLLSWPVTRTLKRLARAAEDVSRGDLDIRVEASGSDEVSRVACAFNDMTESLRRTLRQLSQREALASVGEFAASLAHEVRNPLTSIRLDLQRVEEALPPDSDARDLLARALGQVERVDRSVTGALRVARSGNIESRPVDLRQPLSAASHEAAPSFEASGGTLEPLQAGAGPLRVLGNSDALEQLFLNLLLNAAESLDRGGQAGVSVERHDRVLRISVWDTGRGISPDDMPHVFDAFHTTKPQGTGLGLAIAQRIAAAHGSELKIASTPGEGTTVTLDLNLAEEPEQT